MTVLTSTNLDVDTPSNGRGERRALTHMLYKDALTARLATEPEFLEQHPNCGREILVPADC